MRKIFRLCWLLLSVFVIKIETNHCPSSDNELIEVINDIDQRLIHASNIITHKLKKFIITTLDEMVHRLTNFKTGNITVLFKKLLKFRFPFGSVISKFASSIQVQKCAQRRSVLSAGKLQQVNVTLIQQLASGLCQMYDELEQHAKIATDNFSAYWSEMDTNNRVVRNYSDQINMVYEFYNQNYRVYINATDPHRLIKYNFMIENCNENDPRVIMNAIYDQLKKSTTRSENLLAFYHLKLFGNNSKIFSNSVGLILVYDVVRLIHMIEVCKRSMNISTAISQSTEISNAVDEAMLKFERDSIESVKNGSFLKMITADWKIQNQNNDFPKVNDMFCNNRFASFVHTSLKRKFHGFIYSVTIAKVLQSKFDTMDKYSPETAEFAHYTNFVIESSYVLITFIRQDDCSSGCLPKETYQLETCENFNFPTVTFIYASVRNKRLCGGSFIDGFYEYKVCSNDTFAISAFGRSFCE